MNRRIPYPEVLAEAWGQHIAPRSANAPTVISTFAGCGGSSLGYSMAGYRELLAVEWDANAVETFRANFPGVPVHHGDIGALSVEECLRLAGIAPGELDVFDGSPPCQGFSTAGNREFADNRNQLFREYVRLLCGLRPRAFVMENVSGMVKGPMRLIFADILRELKGAGYRVKARLLNAKWFGVPQSRERLIFIGLREDLAVASGVEPSHPAPQGWPLTVWDAIKHLGDEQDPARGHVWLDESPRGRDTKNWILAHQAKQGETFAGQKRRQTWTKPADTLTTGAGMPYVRSLGCHPQYTRTYSMLEYRLLGSFPEAFCFAGELKDVFKRIGNCVPPLFMRAIASHVRDRVLTPARRGAAA
jgi:DNA (cytosine-5)-methyltransferase 1